MPKIYNVIQGTPEWAHLRCGIPTASNFHRLITPTGKVSTQSEMYLFELLAERITGEPTVEFTSHWQDRGSEMEAEAVAYFEFQRECETAKVGFITNDDGTIGCSPDRLIGEDALLEIKVPKPATHVMYLLKKAVDAVYYPQVQGQLWVSGRSYLDIMSYCPSMPPAIVRVHRDSDFIKLLETSLDSFRIQLDGHTGWLQERGWITEGRASVTEQDELISALKDSLRSMKGNASE